MSLDHANLKKEKLKVINDIILSSAGLMAEMITKQPEAVAGEELNFQLNVISRTSIPVSVQKIQMPFNTRQPSNEKQLNKTLSNDSLTTFNFKIKIPNEIEISEPYWLKYPVKSPSQYTVNSDSLIGLPLKPASLNAKVNLKIEDELFEIDVPFSYKQLDPIKGDVVEPLRIVPEVNIKFTQTLFFQKDTAPVSLGVQIHSHANIVGASLKVKNEKQVLASLNNINLSANSDTTLLITISLEQLKELSVSNNNTLEAVLNVDEKLYSKDQHLIRYNHIPVLQYFTPATTKIMNGNLKVTAKKIGYIQGAGDFIPDFLRMAGMDVTFLEANDLTNANKLTGFDAIILGVRAINVEKRILQWMPILNQYIYNGGTLIVQFNTLQNLSTTHIGPYPFTIGNKRVTEENAKVQFLQPQNPVLNFPNKITDADFEGWIQERGLYFPVQWDKKYTPLFKMHDTGEEELEGATLYTTYGKGHFIYTPLSFFRQLPNGNKGAAKLFFNMLSIGKNEKKQL